MLGATIAIVLLLLAAPTAEAQTRLALLIGNQTYSGKVQPLKSPHNDIKTVGKALEADGFKATMLRDARRTQMLGSKLMREAHSMLKGLSRVRLHAKAAIEGTASATSGIHSCMCRPLNLWNCLRLIPDPYAA